MRYKPGEVRPDGLVQLAGSNQLLECGTVFIINTPENMAGAVSKGWTIDRAHDDDKEKGRVVAHRVRKVAEKYRTAKVIVMQEPEILDYTTREEMKKLPVTEPVRVETINKYYDAEGTAHDSRQAAEIRNTVIALIGLTRHDFNDLNTSPEEHRFIERVLETLAHKRAEVISILGGEY